MHICSVLYSIEIMTRRYFPSFSRFPALLFLLFFLLVSPAHAQIQHGGTPRSSQSKALRVKNISARTLSAIDAEKLKALDLQEGVKNRCGVVETVNLDIREAGAYSEVEGYGVWVLPFSCETAVSMSLYLSTFDIPQGAELFVYNADKSVVLGAFTLMNNLDGGSFAIAEIKGGSYVLEYNEPLDAEFQGGVIVDAVAKSYLSVETKASPARVGINCDAGDDFQNEKRAVARMIYRSGLYEYFCTGSLINNVEMDGTPYFLTANHCISTSSEAKSLITYFNYENSSCSADDASKKQTLSGATLLANSSYNDFSLLELKETLPESYEPFFLGWDASGDIPQSGSVIHHPAGTPKCISIDNDPLLSYAKTINWEDKTNSDPDTHWQSTYEIGADEGGSSGSPILDQNHRIVGQLHGGNDNISLWGKFSLSWNHHSSYLQQVKYWLAPEDVGLTQLDGLDYYATPSAEFELVPFPVCTGSTITLLPKTLASYVSKEWTISPNTYAFVEGTDANSAKPKVVFTQPDSYKITCRVQTDDGFEDTETFVVEVSDALDVQLVGMDVDLSLCIRELFDFTIEAEGAYAYDFSVDAEEYFEVESNKNAFTLHLTDAGQQAGNFETYVRVTGTSGNCSAKDSVLLRVSAPVNDNVSSAIRLRVGDNGPFTNVCASIETDEPYPAANSCSASYNWCPPASGESNPLDNSVWFSLVAPDNGYVEITVDGIANQFALWAGHSAEEMLTSASGTPVLRYAADTISGFATRAAVMLENGVHYYLQVDGKDGAEGDFTINIKHSAMSIFPSVSSDGMVNVVIPNLETGEARVSLFSITGAKIYEATRSVEASQSTYEFNWSFLKPAMYIVHINLNGVNYAAKLIIV